MALIKAWIVLKWHNRSLLTCINRCIRQCHCQRQLSRHLWTSIVYPARHDDIHLYVGVIQRENESGTNKRADNIGCFIGAMSTIVTGDMLGRPRQIIVGSTVVAIGAVIQTASYSVPQIMVGRVISGMGTGMNTATAGVWQAETSKIRSRGKLVIIQMANCITGFSVSNWFTLAFSFAPGAVAWRFPIAFQICFTFAVYATCPFLPDSPRLLMRKGKFEEAREVIAALEGNGATTDSPEVTMQFNIIKDVLDREHMDTYS